MKVLRVGLVVDSLRTDRYVAELVRWAKAQPGIRLSLVVAPAASKNLFLLRAERLLLRLSKAHRDHYAVHDLSEEIVDASGLDLVLSFTQPFTGFWECYRREPQTEFRIRRLTAAGEEVLVRGAFKTLFYYSLNQAHVYKKAVSHVKRLLKDAAATGRLPAPQRSVPAPRIPTLAHGAIYAAKLLGRIARKALGRLPVLRERFGVSVLPGRWDQPIQWQRAATPRGRFWADPFLHTRGGRTFCFVEDLERRTKRGRIAVLEVVGGRLVERGIALEEPFHLSFPFLFEHRGELYMCPESSEAREIRVYRCTEFPLKWRLEKTLMRDVSAADTMLFEKAGRWWMLTNIDEADTGDHCSELYLFSADSPLSASWTPHRHNPILVDSIGGRNGGLIRDGERLYRIGQCQGFDRYGEGLRVYEIGEISESRYSEELVGERIYGTHHLSSDGRTTVIDHAWGL